MDRILYFGYVVLTSFKHWEKLFSFSKYYSNRLNKPVIFFLKESFAHYLRYSMHPLDYFYYDIPENSTFKYEDHATTLFMYRFHKVMNDKHFNKYFYNKVLFNETFKDFRSHKFLNLNKCTIDDLKRWIKELNQDVLIIKKQKSVGGFGVKKIKIEFEGEEIFVNGKPIAKAYSYLKRFDLIEEFVQQHDYLNLLNPSCLNTIRVVTVLHDNEVIVLAAVLRMGVNSDIDNFHSGGIAINVDIKTGQLSGRGFKLNPSNPKYYDKHPITNIKLDGYQLPHWDLLLDNVTKAATKIPNARSIGWDVAITPEGISLIEGNNDWDKIIIEKALGKGIKKLLETFIPQNS
ncbi:MAG TPA: sugar-transfer associated ATP-grasp domain-containing protein [Chitinophagaceae bacterium]|nr:sugar-transfer associated ATP-grasp domain-containing protein [Chitinophagaceae bacterium]